MFQLSIGMNGLLRKRTTLGICLMVAMFSFAAPGCHISKLMQKHPRSIEELYDEAVAARAKYPEYSRMQGQSSIPTEVPVDSVPPSPSTGGAMISKRPAGTVPNPGRAVWLDRNVVQAAASQIESQSTGPRVSEIFEDTEIRQAIQVLATQAGVSVAMDDRIGGTTSAHIENEPFETALRKVLLPLGFIYKKKDGIYLIGVVDPQSALFTQLADNLEFRPMHLAPQELMQLLPDSLKKYVQVIEKRNLILVEAPTDVAQRIVSRLEQSDRPVPQVVLEAMVCVINPTRAFQFNVDAKQSLTIDGKELLNVGLTGLAFTGNASPHGVSNAFSDFALTSTFLRLLAQEGYVTIRAAPRVMAKDGEKATIQISRETFFSVQPNNSNLFFQSTLQNIEAGITLDIVPVVRGDTVTVNIEKAEVSEPIRQQDKTADTDTRFPLINRRRVATTVHVQDGQTIVIGGLVQRQTIDRVSRIPYIGDIPYVGRLFQYIDQEDAEAEVVIFIAPKIVNPPCADEVGAGSLAPSLLSPHQTRSDSTQHGGMPTPLVVPPTTSPSVVPPSVIPPVPPSDPLPPVPAKPEVLSTPDTSAASNLKPQQAAPSVSASGKLIDSAKTNGSTKQSESAPAPRQIITFPTRPTGSGNEPRVNTPPASNSSQESPSQQPERSSDSASSFRSSDNNSTTEATGQNSSSDTPDVPHTEKGAVRFLAPKVVNPTSPSK